MGKSMHEVAREHTPVETADEKRIRDLAAKSGVLSNAELQEAIKLLLGRHAATLAKTRKPRP
jgi:hypothetical protein